MPYTMVTEREPLVVTEDLPTQSETTHSTYLIENKKLMAIDDKLIAHKQKLLMKKILIMILVVNLIVLISIILTS